jgi:hypothetical protein
MVTTYPNSGVLIVEIVRLDADQRTSAHLMFLESEKPHLRSQGNVEIPLSPRHGRACGKCPKVRCTKSRVNGLVLTKPG